MPVGAGFYLIFNMTRLPVLAMKIRWWLIIFSIRVVLSSQPIIAGEIEDAVSALQYGNYVKALGLLRPLAEKGDALAQHNLGLMYENGWGVTADYAEAVRWYRRAADQRHAGSQNNLGLLYFQGKGVPQNYSEALKWFRLSADQGDASAQTSLATMYTQGHGVPRDYSVALKFYRLAADQGYAAARYNLGVMHDKGQGVRQDYDEALMVSPRGRPRLCRRTVRSGNQVRERRRHREEQC